MRFAGTLTERDLSGGLSLDPRTRKRVRVGPIAIGYLVLLTLALVDAWLTGGRPLAWLALGAVLGAVDFWASRERKKTRLEEARLAGPISGTVSEGGVAYRTPVRETFWAWHELLACVASDDFLLLLSDDGRRVLLARTLFASEAEWGAAVRYVKSRLPEYGRGGLGALTPLALALLLLMVLFLVWHFVRLGS